MSASPSTPAEYLAALPDDRREMVEAIRQVINDNLPEGIEEGIQYKMIGWYAPHSVYPDGYHCDPKQPVPYASVANQKGKVSLYLFCMYVGTGRAEAFAEKYRAWLGKKPDMGKSCIRFKKMADIPLELIAEAIRGMPTDDFLAQYTASIPPSAKKKCR
jgi:uncharacterized protein YdhG (YjbR/CyaY superfamily)